MAKTQYEIEMDFRKANLQADRLEKLAKDLRNIADDRLEHVLASVSEAWQGDNATAFIKKGNKVQQQMEERVVEITKIAETLRKIAKNTYDTEMANVQVAMTRTY